MNHLSALASTQTEPQLCAHGAVPGDAGTAPRLPVCCSVTRIQTFLPASAIALTSFWASGGQHSTFIKSGPARYKAGWEGSIFIFDYPSTDQRLCNTVTLQGLLIVKGCLSGLHRESNGKHPVPGTIRYQDETGLWGEALRTSLFKRLVQVWQRREINDRCRSSSLPRPQAKQTSEEETSCAPGWVSGAHSTATHCVGWTSPSLTQQEHGRNGEARVSPPRGRGSGLSWQSRSTFIAPTYVRDSSFPRYRTASCGRSPPSHLPWRWPARTNDLLPITSYWTIQ